VNFNSLQKSKNLLAFSAGGDSTALFFLLLEADIAFDIAHINYHTREQSDDEEAYALALAQKYDKKVFIHHAKLEGANFEANARKERYDFFETIMTQHSYETLLTAHHLNDKLEWFLMQFTKGAGVAELVGMQEIEVREGYTLVRPLLDVSKSFLQNYLQKRKIRYFEDASNLDTKYRRNYFRHSMANELIEKFEGGIQKSFHYLQSDATTLIEQKELHHEGRLSYFETPKNRRSSIYLIDKVLKKRTHLMGAKERLLLQENDEVEIARKFLVAITSKFTFIVEGKDEKDIVMDKAFKELCRRKKVPSNLRKYFYLHKEVLEQFFN